MNYETVTSGELNDLQRWARCPAVYSPCNFYACDPEEIEKLVALRMPDGWTAKVIFNSLHYPKNRQYADIGCVTCDKTGITRRIICYKQTANEMVRERKVRREWNLSVYGSEVPRADHHRDPAWDRK